MLVCYNFVIGFIITQIQLSEDHMVHGRPQKFLWGGGGGGSKNAPYKDQKRLPQIKKDPYIRREK